MNQPDSPRSAPSPEAELAANAAPADARKSRSKVERFVRRAVNSGCWLLFWTMLYVLSIGPMFWQWHQARYVGGNRLVLAFYMPLLYACEIDKVGQFVNWYIDLWILS